MVIWDPCEQTDRQTERTESITFATLLALGNINYVHIADTIEIKVRLPSLKSPSRYPAIQRFHKQFDPYN